MSFFLTGRTCHIVYRKKPQFLLEGKRGIRNLKTKIKERETPWFREILQLFFLVLYCTSHDFFPT
jgi:hypothetical protein